MRTTEMVLVAHFLKTLQIYTCLHIYIYILSLFITYLSQGPRQTKFYVRLISHVFNLNFS